MSLDGRRAVVSGGSKGAGAAVVTRLRAAGAATTVIARHRPDDADDFVQADITTVAGARPSPSTSPRLAVPRSWCTWQADHLRPQADSRR